MAATLTTLNLSEDCGGLSANAVSIMGVNSRIVFIAAPSVEDMKVIEWLTAADIQLRSPPVVTAPA